MKIHEKLEAIIFFSGEPIAIELLAETLESTKEEIVENDYDLSINKYKEIVIEKKEYEHPKVILKRVMDMEDEIQNILKELGELL